MRICYRIYTCFSPRKELSRLSVAPYIQLRAQTNLDYSAVVMGLLTLLVTEIKIHAKALN